MAEDQKIYYAQPTINEFVKLDYKLRGTIKTFQDLISQGAELNALFAKGTPKEYMEGMGKLSDLMQRLGKAEQSLIDISAKYEAINRQVTQSTNNRRQALSEYDKELEKTIRLEGEEYKATARQKVINAELTKEKRQQAQAEVQAQGRLNASISLYNKVELKLKALTTRYNELATRKALGLKLNDSEEKSLSNLTAKISKYDQVLKSVDATAGKNQRNVGNYPGGKGGFDSLGNSINQLSREAPAFANSMQTGFMAISNNLPIFFDALSQTNKQLKESFRPRIEAAEAAMRNAEATALSTGATQAEAKAIGKRAQIQAFATPAQLEAAAAAGLTAERSALAAGATTAQAKAAKDLASAQLLANSVTTKAPSIMGALAKSIFSFQTLLSVGVTLLTIYGKDIVLWAKSLFTANNAMAYYKKNLKDINEAKKEGIKSSATELVQLKTLYRVAQDNALSTEQRMRAVRKLQDLYPSYFANMTAESIMLGKATKQYKELSVAILASAQSRAIEKILSERMEKSLLDQESQQNKLNEAIVEYNRLKKSGQSESQLVSDGQGGLIRKEIDNQTLLRGALYKVGVIKNGLKKMSNDEAKANETLIQKQIQLQQLAAKYESDKYGKDAPKEKTASGLTKEQKDYLDTLMAIRDTEIAIAKERQLRGEIDEKEYWERYIQIIKTYRQKVTNYLNGANGQQRKIEASVRRRAVEEIMRANKEIFDYEKEQLESRYKMRQEVIERKLNEINNSEYDFEIDKIQQRNNLYNEQIADTAKLYTELITKAKMYSIEYYTIMAKSADEIGKLQDKQNNNNANSPKALKEKIDYLIKIEELYREASNFEEKRVILANSKLNIQEREYLIAVAEKDQEIEMLEWRRKNLQLEAGAIAVKAISLKLTLQEAERLAIINNELAELNSLLEISKQAKIDIEWGKLKEGLAPTIDYIKSSFSDLGLKNLSDNFESIFDKIGRRWKETGKLSITAAEAMVLAASTIGDALTSISDAQKDRTIANLEEQLKRSQEVTDQEVGFINDRLAMLNAIQDKTVEQTQERNALEDEARVLKEQQSQREKMIETQKAKAQQRASAQQALISGGVAAVNSYASLASIPVVGPALGLGAAIAAMSFAVLQAGLIMTKNPVPQYFVGTDNAQEGWALTQERGAEIITDKNDNIKSWGNNRGSQMTYLKDGDKVKTAFDTQAFKKRVSDIPQPNWGKIATDTAYMPVINIPKEKIDYDLLADKVGSKFNDALKRNAPTLYQKNENGDTVVTIGNKFPEIRKTKQPKTTIIIKNPNVRD